SGARRARIRCIRHVMSQKRGAVGILAVLLAVALGLGWLAGRAVVPATYGISGKPDSPAAKPPSTASSAMPPAATVGRADPFGVLGCQAREYNDTLALAVTFTQPVDRRASLDSYFSVADAGPAKDEAGAAASAAAGDRHNNNAGPGKTMRGGRAVGDDPRMTD